MSCYCSLQQSVAVCSSLLLLFSSPVIAAGHQIELPKASAEMVRSGADFYLMLQAACYEPHAAACGSVFVLPCRLCAGSLTRARGGRTRKWSHLRLSLISWSVECVPAQLKAQMLSSQQSMGDEMPERIRCTFYDTQRERERKRDVSFLVLGSVSTLIPTARKTMDTPAHFSIHCAICAHCSTDPKLFSGLECG